MSTLILDGSNIGLRMEGGAVVLNEAGSRRGTVPAGMLERVVIQGGAMDLTSGVLLGLTSHGASLLFLSARHSRQVAIVLGPMHNDVAIRLAQSQAALDEETRRQWAQMTVLAKLRRQLALLRHLQERRADRRKRLTDACNSLARTLDSARDTSLSTGSLRGLEGAGAAAYFKGLTSVFPQQFGFCGRNRRPPRDPVNACLSLGYTLVHFDAVRASHVAGLDPLIGLYHGPVFGRESLACDLIEPLRPAVDRWVWRLFADRTLRQEHFNHDKGACLLSKAGRKHFYHAWEEFAGVHRRYLRRRCGSLAARFRKDGADLVGVMESFEDDEAST